MAQKRPQPRRPWGSGGLRELKSGHWQARLRRADGTRESATFQTQAAAREWLRVEAAKGAPEGSRRDVTLAGIAEEYLADLARTGRRRSTRDRTAGHLAQMTERWGELLLADVDGPTLERIVAELLDAGLRPATVRNRVNALTGATRYAMRRGYIPARELPVRRPPVVLASRPEVVPRGQVAALLGEAAGLERPEYLAAVWLLVGAGLRREEAVRARRSDLVGDVLHVPVRDEEDRPKSGQARHVPVPTPLVAAVRRCPARGEERILGLGDAASLSRMLAEVWYRAGLPGRPRLHRLRHTWATELVRRGARLDQLMAWGGWSSLATARRYLHGVEPEDRAAADKLGTAWGTAPVERGTGQKKAR